MLIPVDSSRFSAMFTGNYEPAREWIERADGSRARSDVQASDDSGTPMWDVEIVFTDRVYGQNRTESVMVSVPCKTEPVITGFTPAAFSGLSVNAYGSKTGMRTSWTAEGLAPARSAAPTSGNKDA